MAGGKGSINLQSIGQDQFRRSGLGAAKLRIESGCAAREFGFQSTNRTYATDAEKDFSVVTSAINTRSGWKSSNTKENARDPQNTGRNLVIYACIDDFYIYLS